MATLQLSSLARVLPAKMQGNDVCFDYISTDTRQLQPGQLFIALTGPNFDGHDFVNVAKEQGAVAALVSRFVDVDIAQLCVADTLQGLAQLSRLRRGHYSIPIIGITGSCGKSTTKTLLGNILQQAGKTLVPENSFNNHIGVPLTLMRLDPSYRYAVIEMGANHLGEIKPLTQLARPTVATITNINPVHIEGFGDLAGVARTKSEIFQGLDKDGIAVLNSDDAFYPDWQQQLQHQRTLSFGCNPDADVRAEESYLDEKSHGHFILCMGSERIEINLPLLGEHNIMNALTASACAHSVGIGIDMIKAGLEDSNTIDKRLQKRQGQNGSTLLDDSYNANPTSVAAAVSILTRAPGQHVCIFGEMLELGDNAKQIHADMGELFRKKGIKRIFTVGELTQHTVKQFGDGAMYFSDRAQLIDAVKPLLADDVTILVKGSKRNRMWEFVTALSATQ